MNLFFLQKRIKLILYPLLLLTLFSCGESSVRKDPFAIGLSRYDNRSPNPVFLAHAGDACSILFHKRFHNFLFFLPLNGYSKEEIINVANQKMIRYKNVLRTGDLIWNLLFFTTLLTYSVEVESCETGLVAIARHDLEYLKENAREKEKAERYKRELDSLKEDYNKIQDLADNLQKEKNELEKKIDERKIVPNSSTGLNELNDANRAEYKKFVSPVQNISRTQVSEKPIVLNYKERILKQFLEENQPFSILFDSGKSNLNSIEFNKLKNYTKDFLKEDVKLGRKILLIGHSDWTGEKARNLDLSAERTLLVSNKLKKLGVEEDKIFITFSGGLWPNNNDEKLVKHWNRRVDILLFE